MTGSSSIYELPRLTNEQFIECALFQEADVVINKIPDDYIIRLFAMTSILVTLVWCDFPSQFNDTVREVLETALINYWNKRFPNSSLSESLSELMQLRDEIEVTLQRRIESLRAGDLKVGSEYEDAFREAYENFWPAYGKFVQDINKYFGKVNNTLTNPMAANLTREQYQQLVAACLEIIEVEHKRGKEWAREFFEFHQLTCAKLSIIYSDPRPYQRSEKHESMLQTRGNMDYRYIEYSIVPQYFQVRDFIMLAFKFFHEYTAHLIACMYPEFDGERAIAKGQRINHRIPDELTHGWMVHVSETFFEEDVSSLVEVAQWVENSGEINTWVSLFLSPEHSKLLHNAYKVARKFYQVLVQQVCNGEKARARKLYYRLSFDVISRYPINNFSHCGFFVALDSMLLNPERMEELGMIIRQKCLREEGLPTEFIQLDSLWSEIKLPRLNL